MQFTNCTTRKPLFHEPYESYELYGSWTCIYTPSFTNEMQLTNGTARRPLFHDPYESYRSYKKENAITGVVSVRAYWITLVIWDF